MASLLQLSEDLSISELEAAVQKNLLACYGYPTLRAEVLEMGF